MWYSRSSFSRTRTQRAALLNLCSRGQGGRQDWRWEVPTGGLSRSGSWQRVALGPQGPAGCGDCGHLDHGHCYGGYPQCGLELHLWYWKLFQHGAPLQRLLLGLLGHFQPGDLCRHGGSVCSYLWLCSPEDYEDVSAQFWTPTESGYHDESSEDRGHCPWWVTINKPDQFMVGIKQQCEPPRGVNIPCRNYKGTRHLYSKCLW